MVEGDEQGKLFRLAMESAKIDNYLKVDLKDAKTAYYKSNLVKLDNYKTNLALEQDASASGAQVIALTTRNKQLAEFSNIIPTTAKKRIYDEVARLTFNDPRFQKINERLGLREKDLTKASKYQVMVSLYGAGERTGILQVEKYLAKALDKKEDFLVINSTDRQAVLSEIDARIAKYAQFDKDMEMELRQLRKQVLEVFNKGLDPGDEIMSQLYFLDPKTKDLVERMTRHYDVTVTPQDFKEIAKIMTEYMGEQVPILKTFTRFHGRLAEDFLKSAKPSNADFDWKEIAKIPLVGKKEPTFNKYTKNYKSTGWKLNPLASEILGVQANESIIDKILKRYDIWERDGTLHDIIFGVSAPLTRRTGGNYFKIEYTYPTLDWKAKALGKDVKVNEIKLFWANKLPKSWTNAPSVNFDGKIVEQNFTQTFEERLRYRDPEGKWITNILQVPQKTEASWVDQMVNRQGKINDIADVTHARTAYGVNANHSKSLL